MQNISDLHTSSQALAHFITSPQKLKKNQQQKNTHTTLVKKTNLSNS